jgi:uncharacterized protein YndB with AHSA1/START domain
VLLFRHILGHIYCHRIKQCIPILSIRDFPVSKTKIKSSIDLIFEFEGLPETGQVTLETMKLEALSGGRTKLISQSVFQSVADRDGMLQGGMEEGVNETYDRLAELLKKM